MRGAVPVWGGAGVAVVALAGLGVYLSQVGLDKADKLASVVGLFVGLAGLGVAAYGLVAERGSGGGGVRQRARATGRGRVSQAGRDITAGPARRLEGGDDDAAAGGVAGGEARSVWQRAEAAEDGQVNQAGRDVNER
ncbi:hypothetical protein DI270_013920 [Microbispora triticiradicis]|uniref:Uncharacterized protein n=1 Tax=Microbispora triticiradicis TaxID=2200763 RepID=A0ABX9LKI0_9ACTN|nr:hypothetical protein [Microbispora triticiradicis]RGA04397.1 hypothetical protein DI270_013920 [Microbispora triticiradicis]GLW20023.1 hypothetical protein Mame01_00660 [Microbispora amethystogenes]